jgi:hypothetical protein
MDQLGLQIQLYNRLKHGSAIEHEAFAIVPIVFSVLAVQSWSVVVIEILDEINRHGRIGEMALQDLATNPLLADGNLETDPRRIDGHFGLVNLPKRRQDHRRAMAQFIELAGQTATHVTQTTGLAKRHRFGCCKQNIHGGLPS